MKKEYVTPGICKVNIKSGILAASMIETGDKTPSFDAKEGFFEDDDVI